MNIRNLMVPVLAVALLVGCADPNGYGGGYNQGPNIGTNTVLGAGLGAVGGGLLSRSMGGRDNRGGRTAVGAVLGGLAGGLIGNQLEQPRQPQPQYWGQPQPQPQYWNNQPQYNNNQYPQNGVYLGQGYQPQRW